MNNTRSKSESETCNTPRMLTSVEIKSKVLSLGADRCGIASVERYQKAPKGFHPEDIYGKCKSVVVFLKKMPADAINAENPVVYSHSAHTLYNLLDIIGINLCLALEKEGITAVPVPTDVPYLYWDAENKHGMGIISMRHSAYNAGLGILGRNTLLINRELGNLVYIGAVLIDKAVEPDPIVTDFACPPNCRLCLDACPVHALDGVTVIQKLCREQSCVMHAREWDIYACAKCRKICLYRNGKTAKQI
jgi:epoxyqueuosine reductase